MFPASAMRLRFNKDSNAAASTTTNASGGTSIFSNIGLGGTSLSITGSSNSAVPGSTALERAAAAAAANTQSGSSAATATAGGGDSDDLPPGWRLVSSRASGRDYYLHVSSGSTQWDKPTEAEPRKGVEQAVPQPKSTMFGSVGRMAAFTSMLSQATTRVQSTLATTTGAAHNNSSSSSNAATLAKSGTNSLRASQETVDRDGQHVVEMFENERLDGKALSAAHGDPKRFSDKLAAPGTGQDTLPDSSSDGLLPDGYEWASEWEIDLNYTAVDRDGWTYATDFVESVRLLRDDLSHASRHPTDAVRRRRWIRYRQSVDDSPSSPRDASDPTTWAESSHGPLSESYSGTGNGYVDENADDPFHRTAQKTQSGFRVNMKFPHRGTKDNTKDYQSINLTDVMWLVNAHDVPTAPTDELMREKTANLEEQIKDATTRSVSLERDLRAQHDKKSRELQAQQKKFESLVAQYRKIQKENETLQLSVTAHRATVEALRKDAVRRLCGVAV